MKTAIFGGSFNPIHNGHLNIANAYCTALGLDRVFFVPACDPPLKNNTNLESSDNRMAMVKLALKDKELFFSSDVEIVRGGTSYTVDTVRYFKNKFPKDELFLIVGSDQFLQFDKWKNYKEISNLAVICTASRDGIVGREDFLDYAKKIGISNVFIIDEKEYDVFEVSSTQIRNELKNGKTVAGLLDNSVAEFIKSKGLYSEI